MSKCSQIILRMAVLSAAGLGLIGCSALSSAAGNGKDAPDEFAVLTKAPLIIPPDYNLRPPSPGAASLNTPEPTDAAQTAMFGSSDPQTVAAGMTGNYSQGERLLMANAGVQYADPAIRAELQSDEKSMQGADQSFTDRILYGATDNKAVAPKPPAPIKKKSSGWFDWF